jgi:hypothetical protein
MDSSATSRRVVQPIRPIADAVTGFNFCVEELIPTFVQLLSAASSAINQQSSSSETV